MKLAPILSTIRLTVFVLSFTQPERYHLQACDDVSATQRKELLRVLPARRLSYQSKQSELDHFRLIREIDRAGCSFIIWIIFNLAIKPCPITFLNSFDYIGSGKTQLLQARLAC